MQAIDLLYRSALKAPEAVAVEAPGARLTYAELLGRVEALAAALIERSDEAPQCARGDFREPAEGRVAILAHNTLEHLIAILAVLAADKVWVPLNPLDPATETDGRIAMTAPELLIVEEACRDRLTPNGVPILRAGTEGAAEDTLAGRIERHRGRRPPRHGRPGHATQAIKFTGGSTGRPKGVLQPTRAWVAGALSLLHAFGFDRRERFLLAAPLTHGTSTFVTPVLAGGGTLVLPDGRPTPSRLIENLAGKRITATFLPPTLVFMMMRELDEAPSAERFPALRHLIYGGAPMPPERIQAAQGVFGPVVATTYGQVEAPQVATALTAGELIRPENRGSVGRAALLSRVAIMDGEDRLLPPGETGEIVIRGDLVMTGYLDRPEETAKALRKGWLHTGDIGLLDERGYLTIKDRLREMIITGGFNVYPAEVEAALARHPAVQEAAVFGLPDEKWGEAVQAAVTLRPGAAAEADSLIRHAKAALGSVKAPKAVHLVDDLPRTTVGKVSRKQLRERFLDAGPGPD